METSTILYNIDSGANRSITNDKTQLLHYTPIEAYPIQGVGTQDAAVTCIGRGYLSWMADTGDLIHVPALYSPDAAETIISPTDVCLTYTQLFSGWVVFHHTTSGKGLVTIYRHDGMQHIIFKLIMLNGLWYHRNPINTNTNQPITTITSHTTTTKTTSDNNTHFTHAKLHRLSSRAQYELHHQRFGHCGKKLCKSSTSTSKAFHHSKETHSMSVPPVL